MCDLEPSFRFLQPPRRGGPMLVSNSSNEDGEARYTASAAQVCNWQLAAEKLSESSWRLSRRSPDPCQSNVVGHLAGADFARAELSCCGETGGCSATRQLGGTGKVWRRCLGLFHRASGSNPHSPSGDSSGAASQAKQSISKLQVRGLGPGWHWRWPFAREAVFAVPSFSQP